MKKLLTILLLIHASAVLATNYYVKNSGNDALSGNSPANAWRSISKINSFTFAAGDSILFKCGDRWVESLIVPRNTLNFASYSTGNKPEISGFVSPVWVSEGNGIYSYVLPRLTTLPLNLFSINNVPQQIARYPNTDSISSTCEHGYFECDPVSLTDTMRFTIKAASFRPSKGMLLVLRTKKWRAVIVEVVDVSGNLVTYKRYETLKTGGANTLEPPDSSSGFFAIKQLSYINQFGEWYINPSTRKLSVYFGSENPNSYDCKVSIIDTVINASSRSFITFNNIRITGANTFSLNSVLGKNISINNCEADNSGCRGFSVVSTANNSITNSNANYCLENGIAAYAKSYDNQTVRNCYVHNTGTIIGMGSFNNPADYVGVMCLGRNNVLFTDNTVRTSGLDGFQYQGSNLLGEYNIVDTFCLVLQDHGAYYTYTDSAVNGVAVNYTNRVLRFNFASNGIGNFWGSNSNSLMASGIYNDGASMNLLEYGNTIYNMPRSAITSNEPLNVTLRDNTTFNTVRAFTFTKLTQRDSININILNNVSYNFATTTGGSQVNQFQEFYIDLNLRGRTYIESIQRAGRIDSNVFNLASLTNWVIEAHNPNSNHSFNFLNWRTTTGKDLHSDTVANRTIGDVLFLRNPTGKQDSYFLMGNFISARGVPYSGNIVLDPWTSLILFYVSPIPIGTPIKLKIKVGG